MLGGLGTDDGGAGAIDTASRACLLDAKPRRINLLRRRLVEKATESGTWTWILLASRNSQLDLDGGRVDQAGVNMWPPEVGTPDSKARKNGVPRR